MQKANTGRKGKAPQKNFPQKQTNAAKKPQQQKVVVMQAPRPSFGTLTSGQKDVFVEKADRRFLYAVERDVSISQAEADRLAEIAAVITDCSGTGQLKSVVHPNFSGDYATSNSDHEYFTPNWAPSNHSQVQSTSELGIIVIGANRGEERVYYTSPVAPSLNTAEIDQVLTIPPGAVINVSGAEAFRISVPSSATTAFMTGLLRSNNAPELAILPAPNTAAPDWAYVIDAAQDMSGLAATGDLMNLRIRVSANTCTCVYRIWVRESVSGWLTGPWQLVEGDTYPLAFGTATPWYNVLAAGPPPETSTALAIELCSTDGTEGYFTVELFPGALGGSNIGNPEIISSNLAETTLVSAPISWWNTVASVMGDQLMLGAQEIITCTASEFNNQGTVVAGKLSKGANLSYSEPASDFFTTLSQMPRNNMTGALKHGSSGFHVPDFTDRGSGAYDITRDDVRYYVFRTPKVDGQLPPSMELKVYSNVSYGVTSQVIPTFPVEPVPHVYALFSILSAINTMGTNEGHLKELFNQAKSLVSFILSPEGRKIIGEGISVAKDVAKIVGPALATLI